MVDYSVTIVATRECDLNSKLLSIELIVDSLHVGHHCKRTSIAMVF